jgi:hypothetical protein
LSKRIYKNYLNLFEWLVMIKKLACRVKFRKAEPRDYPVIKFLKNLILRGVDNFFLLQINLNVV